MLRPDFLFRQSALWQKKTPCGYESGVPVRCHAQITLGVDGARGSFYLPAAHEIAPGDRLEITGRLFYVKKVQLLPTHVECEIA